MRVSVSDAKAQLTELVRRAEAGEEIVLTRHDRPVVRLEPVRPVLPGANAFARKGIFSPAFPRRLDIVAILIPGRHEYAQRLHSDFMRRPVLWNPYTVSVSYGIFLPF